MRQTPAGEQTALAVIKLGRNCPASEGALAEGLLDIAGVSQVHLDTARRTIQVFYDGERANAESIHYSLIAASWWNTGHERQGTHGDF